MDIFDFALQMEKDGKRFYQDAAARCGDKGLQAVFNLLADAEQEHYDLVKSMKRGTPPTTTLTDVLDGVKNLFRQMAERDHTLDPKATQMGLYKQGLEIERRSKAFYEEKAAEVKGKNQAALLRALAVEEQRHADVLENIIEFVSGPRQYLETAEWSGIGQQ